MKFLSMVMLTFLTASMLISCSNWSEPEQTTYTIARKGVLLSDENFNVIHVYGFVDNREISRQIAEFLNQSEPNTYFYFEKE